MPADRPRDDYLAVVRMRIRRARLAGGLRQEDVAERLQMSLRSYQRFEAQDIRRPFDPKLLSLVAIADALGFELCELVRGPSDDELRALGERPWPLGTRSGPTLGVTCQGLLRITVDDDDDVLSISQMCPATSSSTPKMA